MLVYSPISLQITLSKHQEYIRKNKIFIFYMVLVLLCKTLKNCN